MESRAILLVEDDSDIASVVVECLQGLGHVVEHVADGLAALEKALCANYGLVILDIRLRGLSGIEVCRRLRREDEDTPILMLTSSTDEVDCVLALELGADDYVTKPFRTRELEARVSAILRRSERTATAKAGGSATGDQIVKFRELELNLSTRSVLVREMKVSFTSLEFDILAFLVQNPNTVFSRQELLESIWGYRTDSYDSAVTTAMCRIRQKIEVNPSQPQYLFTVRGVGYKIAGPESPS